MLSNFQLKDIQNTVVGSILNGVNFQRVEVTEIRKNISWKLLKNYSAYKHDFGQKAGRPLESTFVYCSLLGQQLVRTTTNNGRAWKKMRQKQLNIAMLLFQVCFVVLTFKVVAIRRNFIFAFCNKDWACSIIGSSYCS